MLVLASLLEGETCLDLAASFGIGAAIAWALRPVVVMSAPRLNRKSHVS